MGTCIVLAKLTARPDRADKLFACCPGAARRISGVKAADFPSPPQKALAYGWQDVTTDRTATVAGTDRLRANFDTHTFAARAETGYCERASEYCDAELGCCGSPYKYGCPNYSQVPSSR